MKIHENWWRHRLNRKRSPAGALLAEIELRKRQDCGVNCSRPGAFARLLPENPEALPASLLGTSIFSTAVMPVV
jgi:hypothetical protein